MADYSVHDLLRRLRRAEEDRRHWDDHWQEVAHFVLPTRDFTFIRQPGERRHHNIYDSTALYANNMLAAGLSGNLTNPSIRWFELQASDPKVRNVHRVRQWCYDTTTILLSIFADPRTGFDMSMDEVYLDLGALGTGVLMVRPDDESVVRFCAKPLANMYLIENEKGDVIEVLRTYEQSVRELIEDFGSEKLPADIRGQATDKDDEKRELALEKRLKCAHSVWLRKGRDPTKKNRLNMPWGSKYVLVDQKHELDESGLQENPYLTPRWRKAPGEVYGRGPGMDALPTVKTANKVSWTNLVAGEKVADPPMFVYANSLEGPIRTTSGSIVMGRHGSQKPEPIFTGANLNAADAILKQMQHEIERMFFLDLFRLPSEGPERGHPRMTAAEIYARRQQQLELMAPMYGRLIAELISPCVMRTFGYAARRKIFDPLPPELTSLDIQYQSPLAVAMRSVEASAFFQLMQAAQVLAQSNPGVLDNINEDESFRGLATGYNVPPRWMRDPRDVRQKRQQREQQQNAAQTLEAAAAGAGILKDGAAGIRDIAEAGSVGGQG